MHSVEPIRGSSEGMLQVKQIGQSMFVDTLFCCSLGSRLSEETFRSCSILNDEFARLLF